MRIVAIALVVFVAACATTRREWVRTDGSSFTEEQLQNDRMRCFPNIPQSGPGSMGLEEARACMRMRGWSKSSS
jgi:hypothetical protein